MKLLERKIHLLESLLDGKNIFEANYKAQKLDYNLNSLSDFIGKDTMDVHYNGHYKTYLKKLMEPILNGDIYFNALTNKIEVCDKDNFFDPWCLKVEEIIK